VHDQYVALVVERTFFSRHDRSGNSADVCTSSGSTSMSDRRFDDDDAPLDAKLADAFDKDVSGAVAFNAKAAEDAFDRERVCICAVK
jgi:hypothetical protein